MSRTPGPGQAQLWRLFGVSVEPAAPEPTAQVPSVSRSERKQLGPGDAQPQTPVSRAAPPGLSGAQGGSAATHPTACPGSSRLPSGGSGP